MCVHVRAMGRRHMADEKYGMGKRFGRWEIVRKINKHTRWCRCDCGTEKRVNVSNLVSGKTQSCGCLAREVTSKRRLSHGQSRPGSVTLTYRIWLNMRSRCSNPRHPNWPEYGQRGITVDARWDDFATFLADMGERPPGHTVERKDNDAPYGPENCVWATRKAQARNKRNNHHLTFHGKTQCIAAWADEIGMRQGLILYRIRAGWTIERALTQEVRHVRSL